jgi:phage terminase large subunit-like protein
MRVTTKQTKQHDSPGFGGTFGRALKDNWHRIARRNQLPPAGDWRIWLLLAGRGFGKTRTVCEFVRAEVEAGRACRIALIAATASDCRDVLVTGHSGLLAISPEWNRPDYQPTKRLLSWRNGSIATMYSADEPDRLRGPNFDLAICDELAAWRYPEALDMLLLGLRIGKNPRVAIATTPRPTKVIRDLLAREGTDVVVTRGSTLENRENLAPAYVEQIIERYKGTRLERQEIFGEVLEDTPGALWNRDSLEQTRVDAAPKDLQRIVVAVDPAGSSEEGADETGIVVAGLGQDGQGYVLEDLSGRYDPPGWARRAIGAYHVWKADRIVCETNYGGEMVKATIEAIDASVPVSTISSSRGKVLRAEPIAAFFEQRKAHMVGSHPELEDQACRFTSDWTRARDGSPDRVDALVFALTELMLGLPRGGYIKPEALLAPAADSGSGPVEFPEMASGLFAIVAAGIDPDAPDDIAVVLFSYWLHGEGRAPIVVLDWEVDTLSPDLMHAWAPAVAERLAELRQQIRVPGDGSPIAIEPQGVGLTLYQDAQHAHPVELLGTSSAEQELAQMPLPQRVLSASGHVNAGRVRISRHAHEKMTTHRGATRNHLLQAIAAFGVAGAEQQRVGALLAAFADGILAVFADPRVKV